MKEAWGPELWPSLQQSLQPGVTRASLGGPSPGLPFVLWVHSDFVRRRQDFIGNEAKGTV